MRGKAGQQGMLSVEYINEIGIEENDVKNPSLFRDSDFFSSHSPIVRPPKLRW